MEGRKVSTPVQKELERLRLNKWKGIWTTATDKEIERQTDRQRDRHEAMGQDRDKDIKIKKEREVEKRLRQ